MKYWKLDAPNSISVKSDEPTVLKQGYVKVKVEEILWSTTDMDAYKGIGKHNYPLIPGRNAVGVVSDVFDKEKSIIQKMDRVVIEPYVPCNCCTECANEEYEKCCDLKYMGSNCDGLLQNFVDVTMDQVHHLPDNLPNEQALFTPYVAFCLNIADALKLEKGNHVAIFASTKTGIILAQLVAYYQGVPILVSNNEALLESARDLGIFYCVNSDKGDVEKEIVTITGGRKCRELVLFSDSEFSVKDVYNAAAFNASICLAGFSNKDSRISLAQICQKHLNIFGVYNGVGNFSSAINLLVTGTVQVKNFVGETINFDTVDKALPKVNEKNIALKSLVIKVD